MFDKPTVEAYKKLTAPASLKDKVMSLSETQNTSKRPIFAATSVAAAVLVLVALTLALVHPADDVIISYNGSELTGSTVTIAEEQSDIALYARIVPPAVVTLSVEADKAVSISVTNGELLVFDDCQNEPVASGTDCVVQGNVRVEWSVVIASDSSESMTIGERQLMLSRSGDGIVTLSEK